MNRKFKRIFSAVLSCLMLLPMTVGTAGLSAVAAEGLTIGNLKVCATDVPLGIDTTPTFSWVLTGSGRGRAQSAYRILVSSSEALAKAGTGDVWDSGKTESDRNYDIVYGGQKLSPKTAYYWTVEAWDESSISTGRSAVSRFVTGIFEDAGWQGEWIGEKTTNVTLDSANWIWFANSTNFGGVGAGTQYFRKRVTVPAGKTVQEATVVYTADDMSELYFNGVKVGSTSAWSMGGVYDATAAVRAGENVIAIAATNSADGYGGMIAKMIVRYTDGSSDTIVTDRTWKVGQSLQNNWYTADFNDSVWKDADQCVAYGEQPWGTGVTLSSGNARAAVMLRREFAVEKEIAEAYAYICGLGFFELSINGKLPDDSVMNPTNTQYNKTVLYRTFDVTELLQKGDNAVGVELGNGFYNEISGVWNWPNADWRDDPKLLLNLEIKYTDGTSETVVSDAGWKYTKEGPTTSNGIYYGETYDARKEQAGWTQVGFDESAWSAVGMATAPDGELVCQIAEPVRRTDAFRAKSIEKLPNGSYIVTTPQMVTGWIKLMNINEAEGTKLTITYGEKRNADGTVVKLGGGDGVNGHWWPHAYIQQDNYICKGTENESFEPKFSYKGYQYIQIDGWTGELTADDLVIYRTANDVAITAEFEASNQMLNDLHFIMQNTMLNNFQGKPTDTPLWEKNGWLGDSNVSLNTMLYNFDMSNYMSMFVEIMEDCFEQYGQVPDMVPTAGWWLNGNAPVWNTIYVLAVAEMCNTYGMEAYAAEQYDTMRAFALKDINEIKNNGWIWYDGQLSDWCSPVGGSNPNVGYNEGDSEGSKIGGTGFVYKMLDAMKTMAEDLGKTADAAEYAEAMEQIYTAFNENFFNEQKGIYETGRFSPVGSRTQYRQTSNLVPLAFGLIPEENVEVVLKNLIKDIEEKNYHLDTGVIGTKLILPTLCDYGYADVAYKIVTQTTYPSWGFWLESGSTSTWEMWESTARSYGHFFLGTYDEWFFSHLGGIQAMEDGYKTFKIDPTLVGDLSYVNTAIDTVRGKLTVDWALNDDGTATIHVEVPVGSTADIYFPTQNRSGVLLDGTKVSTKLDGVLTYGAAEGKIHAVVESGSYTFTTATDLTEVYKDSLAEAIAMAEGMDLTNTEIPAELTDAVAEALAEAKKVYADKDAVQKAVSDALNALEAAIAVYNGSETRQAVSDTVKKYEKMDVDTSIYTAKSAAAYESALLTAQKLVVNYSVSDALLLAAEAQLKAAHGALAPIGGGNIALGKTFTASSSHEDSYWGWGIAKINDGDTQNLNQDEEHTGYSSSGNTGTNHEEWVRVDLGAVQTVGNVTVYPASVMIDGVAQGYGMPLDFTIEVSSDDATWKEVYSATDYPLPQAGPQSFGFDAVEGRYVRFRGTNLRTKPTEAGSYRMQITELEVYNVGGTAGTPIEALTYIDLDGAVLNEVFNIDTYEYTATVGADVESVSVIPYATAETEITVNGQKVASGDVSKAIALNAGENVITLVAGGKETKVTVTKESDGIPGDVDMSGTVDVADIMKLKALIMADKWSDAELAIGDMDGSKKLDVGDIMAIKNVIMSK